MLHDLAKRPFRIYNTETREKEEVIPLEAGCIRMYTCGPTIYHFAHIGNFRTYVFEDLLRRTLKFFGFSVKQAMNLTDVDDKTIKGAIEAGISLKAFTEPYRQAFFDDLKTLNIEPVEFYPAATDYIPEMISLIEQLLKKGIAYADTSGNVYFSIRKFPTYGRLSHLHMQDLQSGASGISADEYDKENITDFVLWKSYDPVRDGTIYWESPFGPGRPGWHIECSAMAMKLLGESIDIHVGGVDNCFPHHENEIAQSEGCTSVRFVRYWMHAEHLLVDHKKMSKSLGNFYTLRDLIDRGYRGDEVRYMLLQTHYRTQLNFTFEGLDAARKTLQRLSDFILRLEQLSKREDLPKNKTDVVKIVEKTKVAFIHSLADDLNISASLASLFDMVREIHTLCDKEEVSSAEAQNLLRFLHEIDKVLGLLPFQRKETLLPQELLDAMEKREKARAQKNWKLADECRLFIQSHGFEIEDTAQGPRLKKQ
jgi:cysteinyl-tRNA synthetase